VSRFAQEVRFYALATLVATLATLLLLRALDRPSTLRWLAYAVSLALLGYVDVVALSVLAGHAVGAVLRSWHHGTAGNCGSYPPSRPGLTACLPVVLAGSPQAGRQVAWIPRPGLDLADFAFFGRNLSIPPRWPPRSSSWPSWPGRSPGGRPPS
jgi:mannosyltransferase